MNIMELDENSKHEMVRMAAMVEDGIGRILGQLMVLARMAGLHPGVMSGAFTMGLCTCLAKVFAFSDRDSKNPEHEELFLKGVEELVREYIPLAIKAKEAAEGTCQKEGGKTTASQVEDVLKDILKKRKQEPT